MTKRRRTNENREDAEADEGSLVNSENKVDQLLQKFASEKLRRFQQKLLETLLEKNNRIAELTTSNDDFKRLTVKEMNIISEMYEDKIKLFTDELKKKDNEIKGLKDPSCCIYNIKRINFHYTNGIIHLTIIFKVT